MPIHIVNLEDNEFDSELIRRELQKAGLEFTLVRASGRREFEEALEQGKPDLIISDHNVPRFDGRAALDVARTRFPDIPFILFTGSLQEEAAVGYMKAGAADYILKDRIARLGPAVREALDRARERRTLRGYQRMLRQIIDTDPSLILVSDADGRFLLANQAAAALYGTAPEAMLGKTLADLNVPAEEAALALAEDRTVLATGQPASVAESMLTSPVTGERRWFQITKVPLRLPGDPARLLSVATDITQRRHLEERLRHAQKMEAVGQLAGGVAHDFNNLLTAIIGNADFLLQDLAPGAASRADVSEIRQAADRAAALTRQLLAFSRKQVLQPRALDLNQLVEGVERMLRRLLTENIDVRLHLAPQLGVVHADPGQLEQVLLNLAVNARDAMPDGGKLVIETADADLQAPDAAEPVGVTPGRYAVLAVSDTGVGMDDHVRSHLFEPFFTTKGPGKGTGLGLATVYGIVQQSGGTIWVYSEPNHGTTFKVYLPSTATERAAEAAAAPTVPARGSETVLLVEDAQAVRALANRVLRAAGYNVLPAANGAEAERVASGHEGTIHLLLTDVVMPGLSGRQLAERIGAIRPEMRVLYMSGYTDDAVVHHGVLEEGVAYLEKPFTPDGLARRVRQALDAKAPPRPS